MVEEAVVYGDKDDEEAGALMIVGALFVAY